ncbi:papilin-like isoform X1 [Uranotaenia lowii]|uniref:papilin-like isoform X1 n=1 Tax=Uranotaenia lowii TaxID=190385 RepID=UPI002479FAC1|nr:papilin-like isoform X1 [Uranotaenia lowii]
MPIGERFYYRHKSKVTDGTRCSDESFDVCVDGTCQSVGCDMMLGSNAKEDKCRNCQGDGSGCKTVTGLLDMNNLQVGYNDLLLIPSGATNVMVSERGPSNNYLAIRNLTGFYHLNGNYRIDFPRTIQFAGSDWHYERRPQGFAAPDKLTCLGPTTEAVYLVLLSQDRNVGVNYEYSVASKSAPVDERDSYSWTYTAFDTCSATCGGGIQHRNVTCNSRTTLKQVDDGLCDTGSKPVESQRCGQESCPPRWAESNWSNCSMPCGGEGKQTREVYCERISGEGVPITVDDAVCLEKVGNKPATEQECNRGTICPEWFIGKWTPCNKLCGEGEQTRKVTCFRKENGRITVLDNSECPTEQPAEKQTCMLRPCEGVDYIASSWSGCEECGSTSETRTVHCASKTGTIYDDKFCANRELPELKRECQYVPCEYQWFSSQWSKCSAICGKGIQTRTVVCGVFDGQSLKRADDDYKCDADQRPTNEQECEGPAECPGQWFTGPWTDCTKDCGGGFKSRKVLCIANGTVVPETNCKIDTIELSTESCNSHDCTDDETIPVDTTATPLEDDYDDEEWCEDDEESSSESPDDILMVTEDTSLVDGIDLESTHATTDSSLETDEMMLSDATGFETGATDSDATTDISVVEGSGLFDLRIGDDDEGSGAPIDSSTPSASESSISTDAGSTDSTDISGSTETVSEGSSLDALSSIKVTDSSLDTSSDGIETSSELAATGSTISSLSSTSDDTSSVASSTVDATSESTGIDSTTASETTDASSSTSETTDASSTVDTSLSSDDSTTDAVSSTDSSTVASSETVSDSTDTSTDSSDSSSDQSTDQSPSGSSTTESIGETSDSSDATDTDSTDSSVAVSEESDATEATQSTGPTESTVTEETVSTEETPTTEAQSTDSTVSGATDASTESVSDVSDLSTESSTDVESSTFDIWMREGEDDETSTPYSLSTILSKEQKPRKCKPKPKTPPQCASSKFGCCPDNKTKASGPFDEGCPVPETCKDTKHGCCPDGVSPAKGPKNKGCPKSDCAETLFGCCPDKITPSEGNDNEGCPVETTTVGGCIITKHGCCPDGVTAAKDPKNKGCPGVEDQKKEDEKPVEEPKGCSASPHGCCSDNVTAATGPNGEGCQMCSTEPFGCCPDGKTPAHGYHGEGCCLETPYGCCPDNINPARGPSLEGCGCEYSPYGCCPDNATSARGHNNKGCGCQYSDFGCCPDKETDAQGPGFEGCPCHAFQFGCCPDGITAAKGPHNHGCHCSYSEFKCCSDGQTAAQGPNFEGCTCATSKYGCCPDGVNEAQGSKFEGCEVVPESPQKACVLKKDMGSCHNYTVKYFFDVEYGGCGRFWYGGCEGNKNRFDTAEDCKHICEAPEGNEKCHLPKITGPCTGYYPMWYYDSDRNQCSQFTYGGCLGNANRFETIDECKASCVVDDSQPPCEQPQDAGPCNGTFERWSYDKERDACVPFHYGGCKGNKNNYPTESSCDYHCKKPGVHKQKDICFQPAEIGECQNYTAHWYFDTKEARCRQFYYGGCGGNGNNFGDEQACINRCVHGGEKPAEPERPHVPETPVRERFDTQSCFLEMDSGNRECTEWERRYFYDRSSGTCTEFTYTGCGGNENNFHSFEECDGACGRVEDACGLRPAYGRCSENETRWYYDGRSQRCHSFTFSGCQGNANNFYSEQECEQQCRPREQVPPEQPDVRPPVSVSICDEPYEYGTGGDPKIVYVFNKERATCEQNYYSGEGGNGNRFSSHEQCERVCGEYRGIDVCREAKDSGPCDEEHPRFYFDSRTRRCHEFNYSGCEGNGNRFVTIDECESTCSGSQVDPAVDPCQEYIEECDRIHCPYGVARSYDAHNNCERCSCEDPCANTRCPSGTECAVDLQSDHRDDSVFVAICRPTSKDGECPRLANATICQDACRTDADCRSDNKCCQAGCATVCVPPVQPEVEQPPPYEPGVPAPPSLEPVPEEDLDIKSEEGGIATLRCYATGFPPPSIRWKKGEVVLNTNQGRFVLTSNGDLQIVQLHRTDSGTYVCIADNGIGEPVLREVKLQVNDPVPRDAYIVGTNSTEVVELDQPATLRCPAGGYPKPIVTWWRDTLMMPIKLINRDYSLQFTRVRMTDLGPYVCQAYSGAGKGISKTVTLKAYGPVQITDPVDEKYLRYIVHTRPTLPPTHRPWPGYHPRPTPPAVFTPAPPPTRRPEPVPVSARQEFPFGNQFAPNSNVTIRCMVDGYPRPTVNWYKDGRFMEPTNRIHIEEDNTLQIFGALPTDAGAYKCLARNEHSEAFEENTIRVEGVYIPAGCTDSPFLAKCSLIVQARFCNHKYYARFCCKSCTLAGQLRH